MLMGEPEVKPFVAFVSSSLEIFELLLLTHREPSFVPNIIAEYIVRFREQIDRHVSDCNTKQCPISVIVVWCIV